MAAPTPAPMELRPPRDIDFLPARFREETQERKGQVSRFAVILLLALIMSVASFFQHGRRRYFEHEMTLLQPQRMEAQQTATRLQELEAELKRLESKAHLITYLRHPWPRSQIVAALLPHLPDSIVINSIQINEIANGGTALSAPTAPNLHQELHPETQPDGTKLTRAERDLNLLRARHDHAHVEVLLTGVAADPAQLHEYLSQLARDPLFVRAELDSLELNSGAARAGIEASKAVRFRARLAVRMGHGQPHGPAAAEGQVAGPVAGTAASDLPLRPEVTP